MKAGIGEKGKPSQDKGKQASGTEQVNPRTGEREAYLMHYKNKCFHEDSR
jgi:hypothetical protein